MNLSTNPFFTHGIEKLCTICHVILRDTDTSQSIFSTVEGLESAMNVLQVLQSFSNFNFYNGAQRLCTTCYDKTIEVYNFIQMCNKAHDNMQHYFKNIEAIKTIQDFERDELDLNVKNEPIDRQEFLEEMENEKIDEMEMVICDTEIKIEERILQGMEKEGTSSNEETTISHAEIVTEGRKTDSRIKFNLRSHDQGYNANLAHISDDMRLNQDRHQPLRDYEETPNRRKLTPNMQASTELVSEMKKSFFANLFSENKKYNSVLMTQRKYDSIIEDVKRIKVSKKKESSRDYRIIQRYDVLTVQGCEKLIQPLSDERESVKQFVHVEELFDILYSTHLSIGHGGRDRMIKQLNTLYKNITQAQIKMFLDLCEPCQQKQKSAKKRDCCKADYFIALQ